jgi:hypothetical protein
MDSVVIRVRYPDFSSGSRDLAGLHGSAECDARGITVYLLPGLTGRQRKAVIRRLRQEASRGFGPPLPLPGLAIALATDRIRAAVGIAVGVVRLHPTVTLLPGAAIAAMTLFMVASTGAGPGSVPRTGLDGVLVSNGQLTSADHFAPGGAGMISTGGSELGSGVPALVRLPRPDSRRGHHDGRHHDQGRRAGS